MGSEMCIRDSSAVEEGVMLGSLDSVGLVMSLCDSLNFVSLNATAASNSSRRLLSMVATSEVAERTAFRERLIRVVVGMAASFAETKSLTPMLKFKPAVIAFRN